MMTTRLYLHCISDKVYSPLRQTRQHTVQYSEYSIMQENKSYRELNQGNSNKNKKTKMLMLEMSSVTGYTVIFLAWFVTTFIRYIVKSVKIYSYSRSSLSTLQVCELPCWRYLQQQSQTPQGTLHHDWQRFRRSSRLRRVHPTKNTSTLGEKGQDQVQKMSLRLGN